MKVASDIVSTLTGLGRRVSAARRQATAESQSKGARGDAPLSGLAFGEILQRAKPHYPISDAYERDHLPGRHWWTSQQEHVVGWLQELDGPGAYDRSSRGLGARHAYTHFQCAPGLLWIAEALGEDAKTVATASNTAAGADRPATQCAAIRKVIPWSRIQELAHASQSHAP